MADSSRHSLFYIPEVAYGTTPTNPAFIRIRHTGTTLGLTKTTKVSEELRADRQVADFRHGVKSVGGEIKTELSYGSHDALLEAALCGQWATDVLTNGVTRRSLSAMRDFEDLGAGDKRYHLFKGVEVNTLKMSAKADGIVLVDYGILGQDLGISATAPAGASWGNASTTPVFDSFSGDITEGGSAIGTVTEFSFTLDNGLAARPVIGTDLTLLPSIGRCNVTGQIVCYFEDTSLLEKFIGETESSLQLDLLDKLGNKYILLFPKIKYTGGQPDTQGQGPVTLTLPFQAIRDDVTGVTLRITRDPV